MGNPWEGIEDEDLSDDNSKVFFVPGEYGLLRIEKCEYVEKSKFKQKEFFKATLEVVKSSVPERPAGSRISWMVMRRNKDGKPNARYFANIKKLLMAAFNTDDPADIDADMMQLVTDEKRQVAAGKYVSATATNIDLDGGGKFTQLDWKHADEKLARTGS